MNATNILSRTIERPIRTNSLRNHETIIKLTAPKRSDSNKTTTGTKILPSTNPKSLEKISEPSMSKQQQSSPAFDSRQRTPVSSTRSTSSNNSDKKSTSIREPSSKRTPPHRNNSDATVVASTTPSKESLGKAQKPNEMNKSQSAEDNTGSISVNSSLKTTPAVPANGGRTEELDELEIPWIQYVADSSTDNDYMTIPPSAYGIQTVAERDYDKMIYDLDCSHAAMTASQFETISSTEAEELTKKLKKMKPIVGSLYERIRVQIDAQRASSALQKLDNSNDKHILDTANNESLSEFVDSVQQTSQQTSALLDELFFTSQSLHNMELRYLQHLAGTLALYQQHQIGSDEAIVLLTNILHKIEALLPEDDSMHESSRKEDKQQPVENTCSSPKTTSCASSVSSTSSWSSASYSVSSSKGSVDTAATAVTLEMERGVERNGNRAFSQNRCAASGIFTLVQRIEQALERLSKHLKRQQEELVKSSNAQKDSFVVSAAQEELERQRERSANLVMELERSRTHRGLLMRDEKSVAYLKNQLKEEAKRRQSLKERLASLEHLVEQSKDVKQLDRMSKLAEKQIGKLKLEFEQHKGKLAQQELYNQNRQKELMEVKDKYLAEKHIWTLTEQLILEKCNVVLDDDGGTNTDCKEAVTKVVDRYMAERQKSRTLQQQAKTPKTEEKEEVKADFETFQKERQDMQNTRKLLEEEKKMIDCEREALAKEKESLQQIKKDIEKEKQELDNRRRAFEQEKQELEKTKSSSIPKSSDNAGVTLHGDLEQQLRQLREAFRQAQHTYTMRESAFMLQSASTEAELERLLKEYDRLTRNIVDFNTERKKLEDEIQGLCQEKLQLEKKITDQQVVALSENNLRKEFRELMATVKENHSEALLKELDKRRQLEQELRDVKADSEMKRWDQVNVGVQTTFDFASTMISPELSALVAPR